MMRLGYPTQNLTIPASTNRSCRLAGLADADKVRALVRENLAGLEAILRWNAGHGVPLFRMGQALIPFASHPEFPYDWEDEHGEDLSRLGELARTLGIRLSMHPGQYIQPASPRPGVSERGLGEFRYVERIFDLIGSEDSVIVLHMGGAYEDRPTTATRFVETMRPESGVLEYLALENDERVWTVQEIVATAGALGIPAITDAFHHGLDPGGLKLEDALDLTLPTWGARPGRSERRPKLHLSSQDGEKQPGAHAYLVEEADWLALVKALGNREADVMIEAKGKERALGALGVDL